ncbi:unnamed protein product [Discula destructiva]
MASSQQPADFTFHHSVAKFNVLFEDLLKNLNLASQTPISGLATGAIVFSQHHEPPHPPRILLVQRASTDSMPDRWEIPGGAVDVGEMVLAGAVREVYEESGLVVRRIEGLLSHDESESKQEGIEGGYLFHTRSGKRIMKFTFLVEVDDSTDVKLDPNEHQDYVWATEDECRAKKVRRSAPGGRGDVELGFTTQAQEAAILKAFSERIDEMSS